MHPRYDPIFDAPPPPSRRSWTDAWSRPLRAEADLVDVADLPDGTDPAVGDRLGAASGILTGIALSAVLGLVVFNVARWLL